MRDGELGGVARRAVEDYLGIVAGERFLIVTDTMTSPSIAPALAKAAESLGADPVIAVMTRRSRSGEEPPPLIASAMVEADVVLAAASRSCYHTEAKGAAQAAGTRGVFNTPSQEDAWLEGAMTADFIAMRDEAMRLADALRGGSEMRVTSPAGTDVTFSIEGREPKGWLTGICRNPGEISAFPGGEVSLPPVEGTAAGRIVIERVMTDIGLITTPMTWTVRDGLVTDITGGPRGRASAGSMSTASRTPPTSASWESASTPLRVSRVTSPSRRSVSGQRIWRWEIPRAATAARW